MFDESQVTSKHIVEEINNKPVPATRNVALVLTSITQTSAKEIN